MGTSGVYRLRSDGLQSGAKLSGNAGSGFDVNVIADEARRAPRYQNSVPSWNPKVRWFLGCSWYPIPLGAKLAVWAVVTT